MEIEPADLRECPLCKQPAYIRIIIRSRDRPGHDEFLYECSMCAHAEVISIARN